MEFLSNIFNRLTGQGPPIAVKPDLQEKGRVDDLRGSIPKVETTTVKPLETAQVEKGPTKTKASDLFREVVGYLKGKFGQDDASRKLNQLEKQMNRWNYTQQNQLLDTLQLTGIGDSKRITYDLEQLKALQDLEVALEKFENDELSGDKLSSHQEKMKARVASLRTTLSEEKGVAKQRLNLRDTVMLAAEQLNVDFFEKLVDAVKRGDIVLPENAEWSKGFVHRLLNHLSDQERRIQEPELPEKMADILVFMAILSPNLLRQTDEKGNSYRIVAENLDRQNSAIPRQLIYIIENPAKVKQDADLRNIGTLQKTNTPLYVDSDARINNAVALSFILEKIVDSKSPEEIGRLKEMAKSILIAHPEILTPEVELTLREAILKYKANNDVTNALMILHNLRDLPDFWIRGILDRLQSRQNPAPKA